MTERETEITQYALRFLLSNIDESTEEDLKADADTLERELQAMIVQ
jgi:hypothetical protein